MLHCPIAFHSFLRSFFFNHPSTTQIYTLSLHDALPIYDIADVHFGVHVEPIGKPERWANITMNTSKTAVGDRKSTRLNSSHLGISYAVFCLKKKTVCRRADGSFEHCRVGGHPRHVG